MKARSIVLLLVAAALGAALAGCKKSVPPNVAATVNGRAITYADLDKQYKRQFPQQQEGATQDQILFQKLELLRAMIDEEILLQRAEKLGLLARDEDVEARLNEIKAPYTQEEFQKQLDAQGMTLEELKSQIRRSLSIEKLLNKEIGNQIVITDKDVADFYNANQAMFRFPETNYHIARIVVTAGPSPDVRNLSGSKAQNEDQARKKIQMIEARLKQGEDFAKVAQAFSEDPQSAPNGGDMGFIPESALQQADPETRKVILSLAPGQISPPLRTQGGWQILKLIAREPAGQRELNDPRVQQNIRETLRTRKEQLLRNAYLDACRNEAQVVNYLALSIAPGFSNKK
ncbi:MAG: peptidylprolyl isomerase [Bryobacteraceae bacterium]|nr:peptidylprolyl isomerase [Bryobacteraceae bacterium]